MDLCQNYNISILIEGCIIKYFMLYENGGTFLLPSIADNNFDNVSKALRHDITKPREAIENIMVIDDT